LPFSREARPIPRPHIKVRWAGACHSGGYSGLRGDHKSGTTASRDPTFLVHDFWMRLVDRLLPDHVCRRSGDCCIILWGSFEATHEDIARWRAQGREDILKHLSTDSRDPNRERGVFVTESCPFLKRDKIAGLYSCAIQETKPFYCRIYPDDGVCEHQGNADI